MLWSSVSKAFDKSRYTLIIIIIMAEMAVV